MPRSEMAVLLADISDSTKLYAQLGYTSAKQLIDERMKIMRAVIAQYHCRVIRTIGDKIMCVLPDADSAHLTASDIQIKVADLPVVHNFRYAVRIGFHVGPVIEENDDVFGDAVKMAARMPSLANSMQFITTLDAAERLSPALRESTRRITALSIKGKGDEVVVCEVLWEAGSELTMAAASLTTTARSIWCRHRQTPPLRWAATPPARSF